MAEKGDYYKSELEKIKGLENVKEQISVVKEICKTLNSKERDITPVIKLLVEIYVTFPAKHQVKRVLISAVQSLPTTCRDIVVEELSRQMLSIYKQCTTDLRQHIDIIAGLMDNFPLGERCIQHICLESLQFVSSVLSKILDENSLAQSSIKQNELMHNCLASIQAGNRIIQKCFHNLTSKKEEDLHKIMSSYLSHDINILNTDEFLMDCKTTCAINVVLLIRLKYHKESVVQKVVEFIFRTPNMTSGDESNFTQICMGDNLSCQLCLLYGTISIMELHELTEEMHDGKCLLLDYLFTSIGKISKTGFSDSIHKLLVVKCYNMWTFKTCACLRSQLMSQKQRKLLQGEGHMITEIMSFVWTIWEDSTDVIRIIAREIFENVLQIHSMAISSDPRTDVFLQGLTHKLMFDISWSSKGKYGLLCNLVQIVGMDHVLQQAPDLARTILSQMSEHALACHASELYIQICLKHHTETPDTWLTQWIDPILLVMAGENKQQTNNIMEYILTKLLKKNKDILPYILKTLSNQSDVSQMASLVTCLRRARMMGLLDKQLESSESVNSLINLRSLQQSLCHLDEQVRLDAFAFLCESHKTTAIIKDWELELIKSFLPWNLNSQSPAFRQQMLSYLKKLLCRMKESETVLLRHVKKSDKGHVHQLQEYTDSLKQYKDFLSWITRHLFNCLYPGSSFARRTTCLTALTLLVETFGSQTSSGYAVCQDLVMTDFNVLTECLTDTFEDNKMETYKLLKYFSTLDIMKQGYDTVDTMFETALTLAGSTRPQDCSTAAYMFKVLLLQTEFYAVMTTESRSRSFIASFGQPSLPQISASQSGRVLHLLVWLIEYLKYQIKKAQENLMVAACNKPLYPTLHSLRYVMQDVKFSVIPDYDILYWRTFLTDLITSCLQISEVVSPIVQNSSPEGNIPVELLGDTQHNINGHSIMPEYLTVCCWRSIKEVSLLLGQLCTSVPITGPEDSNGLLTCPQICNIGGYFKTQLLESIHRGAFELAYAGFVKMCDMLWRSTIPDLYILPKLWLSQLMDEVKSISSKLCATRRSAGVPFYVQALVTTEPATTGRQCFKQVMTDLLKLALMEESCDISESKVHSLNILRAMYRDTRLGEDVTPFVAGGLQAAIQGFKSKFWAICNSSTLLFSALMTRIFGVKRSKDESNISKKNCQTGKAFFHKYPGLYNFMLELLAEATENVGDQDKVHLHPSLYPLLMVLARLFPSPLEGTDTSLNLSAFIPYILRCSASAVLRTRQMSAKAMQPLVVSSNVVDVVKTLLCKLPVTNQNVQHSHIHGILLQIHSVIEIVPSLDPSVRLLTVQTLVTELESRTWLMSRSNNCYVTRKEAFSLTTKLLTYISKEEECSVNTDQLQSYLTCILHTEQKVLTDSDRHAGPGYIEYLTFLVQLLLFYSDKGDSADEKITPKKDGADGKITCDISSKSNVISESHCPTKSSVDNSLQTDMIVGNNIYMGDNSSLEKSVMGDNSIDARLMLILNCCHYEVRMIGLMFLHSVSSNEDLGEDFVFNCEIPVDRKAVDKVLLSSKVLQKLIQMLSEEEHFECQKLVFNALKNHPFIVNSCWFNNSSQLIQLFRQCMTFIDICSRDDIRAEVIQLTGFLVKPMLECVTKTQNSKETENLLVQWKNMLTFYRGTEQHYQLQLAVIKVLCNNTEVLLVDSLHFWGEMTLTFWDILVNLLQEDEDEVKNTASKVICSLLSKVQVIVHPFLALDLAIGCMLRLHYRRHWMACCKTLLRWMETSQDEELGEGGRLFDKNEMNTWRDEVQFVKIIAKYLVQIILSFVKVNDRSLDSVTKSLPVEGDNTPSNDTFVKLVSDNKLSELQSSLIEQFPTDQFQLSVLGENFLDQPVNTQSSVHRENWLDQPVDAQSSVHRENWLDQQVDSQTSVHRENCLDQKVDSQTSVHRENWLDQQVDSQTSYERWTLLCSCLCDHLSSILPEESPLINPYTDINKHIQCSINKFKVALVTQICHCVHDSQIVNLLHGKSQ